jgi:hypothetical protein
LSCPSGETATFPGVTSTHRSHSWWTDKRGPVNRAQIDHDTTAAAVERAIDLRLQRDHHPRVELAFQGDHPNLATLGRVKVIARAQSSR